MLRRSLAAAFLLLFALALLILSWPQLLGLERAPFVAQFVSLRGLAVAVAVVVIVVLGFITVLSPRIRRLAAATAVIVIAFALVNLAVLGSRGVGNLAFETPTDSTITVLSWNTLGDAPHDSEIAALAIDSEADIVVLSETTQEAGEAIAALISQSGTSMQVFTESFDLVSKARSTTLLVSWGLGEYVIDSSLGNSSVLPTVIARPVNGEGPLIVGVHLVAPIVGEMDNWNSDLDWIAGVCSERNVIMAGDFNSTIDHYAALGTADGAVLGACRDAALDSNNAAVGSWPTVLPTLVGAPIDHVMNTPNWKVTGMRVIENHDGYGSDHRPVLAQLAPAGK